MRGLVRLNLLLCCIALAACREKPPAPASAPPPPPAPKIGWPSNLLDGVTGITISRQRGDEPKRTSQLTLTDAGWRMIEPYTGAADPDAMSSFFFALKLPAPLTATGAAAPDGGTVAFEIDLKVADGGTRTVRTWQVPLGQPVITHVVGVGTFSVPPAEFANAIPDPADFAPAGLWTEAPRPLTKLIVRGPRNYEMVTDGGEWSAPKPVRPEVDLEDVPGIIIGRESQAHFRVPLKELGLDPPTATVTLCAGGECRDFRFGTAVRDGQTTYFAVAPGADPISIHPPDWDLIVNGPFPKKAGAKKK